MSNSVHLTGTQQLVVTETTEHVIEIITSATPAVVEVATAGPQGPQGIPGTTNLYALEDVNVSAKVANSVLYYDAISGTWKGDDINTVTTLTDGGAF